MNPRNKRITAALAGAVALASGAYAFGSQQDDGSAQAARQSSGAETSPDRGRGPGLGLDGLARKLGVPESKLRSALEDLRGDGRPVRGDHGDFAAELSDALGVSEPKVKSALDALREKGDKRRDAARDEFTAKLAEELVVSEAKVRSAFPGPPAHRGAAPPRRPPRRDGKPLAGAAGKLRVSESKLRSALEKVRPDFGPGERRGGKGLDGLAGDLAKELGVSQAPVEKALERLRAKHEKTERARRADFAERLADKLGISTDKVKSALVDRGPRGFRQGPGGPGPGGPGGFGHGRDGPGVGPGGPPPGGGL